MADQTEATLTTDIRVLFNEPSALGVTDADITAFLDEASMDIASKTQLLRTGLTIASTYLATGVWEYKIGSGGSFDIATSLMGIDHVLYLGTTTDDGTDATYVNARGLGKIHPRMIYHLNNTAGVPIHWYHTTSYNVTFGASTNVLGIWPPPSASENGKMVKIFYHELINEYDTAATVNLPEWLQDIPVWYAYAKCLERDGKFAQAEQYMSYYNNMLMFWRQDFNPGDVDSKDMMTVPDYTRVAQ